MSHQHPGPFKAVLFDLDGTLLDTIEDIAFSLNSVLARHGYPTHTVDQCRIMVGYGMQDLVRSALPADVRDGTTFLRMQEEMRQAYAEYWKLKSRPFDGIGLLLDAIDSLKLKKAILSNKPDAFTKLCAEHLLEPWRFDVVMGHHEGIAHKPDPQGALMIAETLGVEPSSILYVGDSGIDMQTAVSAGMYPAGAVWGYRDAAELRADGASFLAENPVDLIGLLNAASPHHHS
ncbi:MAG: HAD family hydrolase [Chlorobiaceae bacterium]|nr:HAD family hydrolase [Chlorobiaceae bacterium]